MLHLFRWTVELGNVPGPPLTSSSALFFACSPALSVSCATSLTNSDKYVPMMWSRMVASARSLARSSSICLFGLSVFDLDSPAPSVSAEHVVCTQKVWGSTVVQVSENQELPTAGRGGQNRGGASTLASARICSSCGAGAAQVPREMFQHSGTERLLLQQDIPILHVSRQRSFLSVFKTQLSAGRATSDT